MELLARFVARLLYHLLGLLKADVAEKIKREELIKEEGARAEAGSKESVSDLTGEDHIDFGTPETPAPIKEGKNVPTKKQGSGFFKHRRERNKP